MKKLIQRIEYDEVEVDSPFYSYVQEEDKEIFVQITETTFKQITSHISGYKEIFTCRNYGQIANVWWINPSTKEEWEEALSNLKDYLSKF
jgi:hypothetical protein